MTTSEIIDLIKSPANKIFWPGLSTMLKLDPQEQSLVEKILWAELNPSSKIFLERSEFLQNSKRLPGLYRFSKFFTKDLTKQKPAMSETEFLDKFKEFLTVQSNLLVTSSRRQSSDQGQTIEKASNNKTNNLFFSKAKPSVVILKNETLNSSLYNLENSSETQASVNASICEGGLYFLAAENKCVACTCLLYTSRRG